MKTAWALVMIAIATLGGATLLLAGISSEGAGNLKHGKDPNTMAAYRDGLYHARLQAKRGEEPHLAVGRWQKAADRELFVAGFRQGFSEYYAAHPELKRRPEALPIESVRFDAHPVADTGKTKTVPEI